MSVKDEAALQCCLLCGRTITEREQHDALEASVLHTIRVEHPEWNEADGVCAACITYYRALLKARVQRADMLPAEQVRKDKRNAWLMARVTGAAAEVFAPLCRAIRLFGKSINNGR